MALKASDTQNYVLSVVAKDCGGLKSAPVIIVIKVKKPCKNGWTDVSTFVNYIPSTGPHPLFPEASLHLCPEEKCDVETTETTVALETRHIGKGCDRDTYSLANQRRLCGASQTAVDLLVGINGNTNSGLKDVGSLSDQSITHFDGRSGFVASGLDPAKAFPGDTFTLATWLKHASDPKDDKHKKEHILCNSDESSK